MSRDIKRRGNYKKKENDAGEVSVQKEASTMEQQAGKWNHPTKDDDAYMEYCNILNRQYYKGFIELDESCNDVCSQQIQSKYDRRFRDIIQTGTVRLYSLHMYFITQHSNFSEYEKEDCTLPVVVKFGQLFNVLIPFNSQMTCIPDNFEPGTQLINVAEGFVGYYDKNSRSNVYVKDMQCYCRIGDWLTTETIYLCFKQGRWGNCNNFVTYLAVCCQYERAKKECELKKSRCYARNVASRKRDKRTATDKKANEKFEKYKKAADGIEMFGRSMNEAYKQVGAPSKPIRSEWESWSVLSGLEDQSKWGSYCRNQVEVAAEIVKDFDPSAYVGFNWMVIMISSQVAMDEQLRTCYLKLSQRRITPEQWLLPLQYMSAFDYMTSIGDTMKRYVGSIYRKRAHELLMFIIVVVCRFRGKMPEKREMLIPMRGLGNKKIAVVLNSLGSYHAGIGIGVDSHLLTCLKFFLDVQGEKVSTPDVIWQVTKLIKAEIGKELK